MPFLVAGFVNADMFQAVKARGTGCFQLLIYPVADAAHCVPFHPQIFRDRAAGCVYAQPCTGFLKTFGETAVVSCPGNRCCHHAMFPAAYPWLVCLNIYFASAYVQGAPTPTSAPLVVPRRLAMTDSAPALLVLSWPHGDIYFVHLGIDGDVLQDKTGASDDSLNKLLGSHLGGLLP